eukprot:comp6523_c0_seq1/m.2294 comp6523_c0_seq1/g.2294  ORF comp6523_c0_seq1/g.2294 comp6523_c0_seq1/m.2294 type:complete len:220 (-) comp6523_c0_seq1:223-882(-)
MALTGTISSLRPRMFGLSNGNLVGLVAVFGVVNFYLFSKGLLPHTWAKYSGRVYFYILLPVTITARLFGGWWNELIPGSNVYIGALPLSLFGHVDKLYSMGIRSVVNCCDEYAGPVHDYSEKRMAQLYIPTVDHLEPSLEDIKRAVAFIQDRRKDGGVYIHCKGGVGRSGAVAFCWLLAEKKMGLKETQDYLLTRRKVHGNLYQRANVQAFYDDLQKQK